MKDWRDDTTPYEGGYGLYDMSPPIGIWLRLEIERLEAYKRGLMNCRECKRNGQRKNHAGDIRRITLRQLEYVGHLLKGSVPL